MNKQIYPTDDRVLVEVVKAKDVSAGGIFLPVTAQETPEQGVVRGYGPNVTIGLRLGNTVVFNKYAGTMVMGMKVLKQADIVAIIEEES